MDPVILKSDRFTLRVPGPADAGAMADFYRRNREFLQPTYPTFTPAFFQEENWRTRLGAAQAEFLAKASMRTVIFDLQGHAIGVANFHSFSFRPLYDCLLGYAMDEHKQGKGILTEALTGAIPYVFKTFNLHRITAGYMPRNERSARVLRGLGFRVEGYFRDYLLINGKWEDHVVTSRLNEEWQPEEL